MTLFGLSTRILLLNITWTVLIGLAWTNGIIDKILAVDDFYFCRALFVLFVIGCIASQRAAHNLASQTSNLPWSISTPKYIATTIVTLSLLGTMVGFYVALSDISADTFSNTTLLFTQMGETLHGIAMALVKSMVGTAFAVPLGLNYRVLQGGVIRRLASV